MEDAPESDFIGADGKFIKARVGANKKGSVDGKGKVVAIDAAGLCSVKYCIGGLERRIESTALTLVEPAAESDTPAAAE